MTSDSAAVARREQGVRRRSREGKGEPERSAKRGQSSDGGDGDGGRGPAAGAAATAPKGKAAVINLTASSGETAAAAAAVVMVDCTTAGGAPREPQLVVAADAEDKGRDPWRLSRAEAVLRSPPIAGSTPKAACPTRVVLSVQSSCSTAVTSSSPRAAAPPPSLPPPLEPSALQRALTAAGRGNRRNQFVCQQLCCMWGEQLAKAKAGVESGSAQAIRQASTVFLATAALEEEMEEEEGEEEAGPSAAVVGAAALFYPRPASRHAPPHLYVELMVSSAPGKGLGVLLLRYVEAFAAANAEALGGSDGVRPTRLEQIRLLGVESARGFYGRCGYRDDEDAGGGDDEEKTEELKYRRKEMVKQIGGGGKQQQQDSGNRAAVVLVAAAAAAVNPGLV